MIAIDDLKGVFFTFQVLAKKTLPSQDLAGEKTPARSEQSLQPERGIGLGGRCFFEVGV